MLYLLVFAGCQPVELSRGCIHCFPPCMQQRVGQLQIDLTHRDHSRPRSLASAGRLSSIPQTHLTAVMGPLCLATPSPPEVASTDPRPRQRPSRPSAWRLWGSLPVPPTIAPHRGLRAARARYGNGFLAARRKHESLLPLHRQWRQH